MQAIITFFGKPGLLTVDNSGDVHHVAEDGTVKYVGPILQLGPRHIPETEASIVDAALNELWAKCRLMPNP